MRRRVEWMMMGRTPEGAEAVVIEHEHADVFDP